MPSFADDIVLAILALLLFGPKKLPVLARELGKWVGEFRRASNEFKFQMEEELRQSEQAERQKQIAAMEAAAPPAPALASATAEPAVPATEVPPASERAEEENTSDAPPPPQAPADTAAPLPIATSGSLHMMPPETGLPMARGAGEALGAVLQSIPERDEHAVEVAHGD